MDKFYITNGVTHDGFGSRVQRCISVMCLVYHLKELGYPVEYVHTPFSYIGFNEDYSFGEFERIQNGDDYPYSDNNFDGYMKRAAEWDNYMGFKGINVTDLDLNNLSIVNSEDPLQGYYMLSSDVLNKKYLGKLYVIKMIHKEYDSFILDINIFHKHRNNILNNFSLPTYNSDKKNVAIHIRRKDAINYETRYLPDSYYTNIISELNNFRDLYDITIYTQRVGFNPEHYEDHKIMYDDIQDDYETFARLISADHLITGKSSFSYAAALLNNNVVVYHNTGHIGLPNWISSDEYINLIRKN